MGYGFSLLVDIYSIKNQEKYKLNILFQLIQLIIKFLKYCFYNSSFCIFLNLFRNEPQFFEPLEYHPQKIAGDFLTHK